VDLGEVRVGLAVSDPSGVVATPVRTVRVERGLAPDGVAAAIAAALRPLDADEVVVGLPRDPSGREGEPARRARAIARSLAEMVGLPVHVWDERYSTVEADRSMREQGASGRTRRAAVDRVAATLVLQSYLDSRRSGARRSGSR